MKEVYVLATERVEPASLEALKESFEAEEVTFTPLEGGYGFLIDAEQAKVEVRFEVRDAPMALDQELLTGSDEAIAGWEKARGFYRVGFEPGKGQPSIAVFEALWCVRNLLELVDGVVLDITAAKLHDADDVVEITELDFDIRDHVNLHAVEITDGETPLWVHTHGMEKFGSRDVEMFHLGEADLPAAEGFLYELCLDLAFGQGPPARALVETSAGDTFILQPSEEARVTLMGVPLESFEGHEGLFLTAVSPHGRHNTNELLKPYRARYEKESEEQAETLKARARGLLPAFKARFYRKGLMEPLTFLVRAPFEVHPGESPVLENLWLEVVNWEEDQIIGKLVDGATHTTEWRKGAHVEIAEEMVNAIALGREGRTLDEPDMIALLNSERPM